MPESILTKRREPFRFMLYLGIGSSLLMFGLILMIYFMKTATLPDTSLPRIFWLSTIVILASSLTFRTAKKAFYAEHFLNYRAMLWLTFVLGTAFIVMQILGWRSLFLGGSTLQNNNTSAFVYVLTGLHLLHILGGLFFIAKLGIEAVRNKKYTDSFVYSVNPPNQLRLRLVGIYWHFVDILWVILFAFLVYHNQK